MKYTTIKLLALALFFMLTMSLISCSDGANEPIKKSAKTTPAKTMVDPFLTTTKAALSKALSQEKTKQYQQRQVTEESYQAVLQKVQQAQKDIKQQGGNFTYQAINFNKENNAVDIRAIEVTGAFMESVTTATKDFKDTKNLSIDWYDDKNEIPYFIKASMHDIFVANEAFLQTPDGKEMIDLST